MNKKKQTKIIAIVIASLLAIGMLIPAAMYIFAADEKPQRTSEVPLLVIIANFDANVNGQNDYDSEQSDRLFADKDSKYFGEQWAKTTVEDCYNTFFGDGTGSVADYFNEISCGALKYIPAKIDKKEDAGVVNDGVLSVTIKGKHPSAYRQISPGTYKMYRVKMIDEAIELANAYVDFSVFDKNSDGKIYPHELRIVVINPGYDEDAVSVDTVIPDDIHFGSVKDICKRDFEYDNIKITSGNSYNVVSLPEYFTPDTPAGVGNFAYQVMRLMGGADIGNNGIDETGHAVTVDGWPLSYNMSLLCDGYKLDSGKTPSYADPYTRIRTGLSAVEELTIDGEFTLYSTKSGKYNVLRIPTPDSEEYFLVELRRREGFDKYVSSGDCNGGIMVWHIDESINSSKYEEGYSCTSVAVDGARHEPGIVPLVRTGWNRAGNRLETISADNPFYYISDDKSTAVFDSSKFSGAIYGGITLNSYPEGWDTRRGYNVRIEVLSEDEDSVKLKVQRSQYVYLPLLTAECNIAEKNAVTISANIYREFGEALSGCGIIISKEADPTEKNGIVMTAVTDENRNFYARFEGLDAGEKYYFKAYATTKSGTSYSDVGSFETGRLRDYYLCYMYRNITADESPIVVKCTTDKPVSYDFPMTKAGYRFIGWYTDAGLTKAYDMSTIKTDVNTDISLYAKWEKESTTTTTTVTTETTPVVTTTVPSVTTTTTTAPAVTTTAPAVTTVTTTSTSAKETVTTDAPQTTTDATVRPDDGGINKNILIVVLCVAIVVICVAFITTIGFMRKKSR